MQTIGTTNPLTLPIASSPLSKNSTTPSPMKANPNVTRPSPISVREEEKAHHTVAGMGRVARRETHSACP